MLTRRRFLTRGSLGVAALAGTALGFPGDGTDKPGALPDGSASKGMVPENAERAIDRHQWAIGLIGVVSLAILYSLLGKFIHP